MTTTTATAATTATTTTTTTPTAATATATSTTTTNTNPVGPLIIFDIDLGTKASILRCGYIVRVAADSADKPHQAMRWIPNVQASVRRS